ncbi:crotonase/enoyl-CoA hydratase family protein [Pigmentiphaga soli]|uniref:Crotonase/enoyl-CoA hydratase family protein n=1 Tax=Pigmentiphaga soli TaxID=1007095 RepID=A0ABP8HLN1_9BURK
MSIDVSVSDHIALIVLNRPERMNAFDRAHYLALSEAFARVRDDPGIRVAVVTGQGERAFSTGADLKDLPFSLELSELMLTQNGLLPNRGMEVWKPIVSAVNGYCLAGGMCLMLGTDIRIAAEHAVFGLSEVKRGLIAANGGVNRVVRQLPYPIAMELLLTGDTLDAAGAERWGLVNRVVPMAQLMDEAMRVARRIAANAPLAVQAAKEVAQRGQDLDMRTGLRLEQVMLRMLQGSEDAREGVAAFAEKRQPVFQAR